MKVFEKTKFETSIGLIWTMWDLNFDGELGENEIALGLIWTMWDLNLEALRNVFHIRNVWSELCGI